MRGVRLGVRAALLLVVPAVTPSEPAAATVASAPSCHGRDATLVGTPGELLVGTSGDDVIVGNGAGKILGGAGDDLICVTGDTRRIIVRDGLGDDLVDARDFRGGAVVARLGDGSDRYDGSRAVDFVSAELGRAGDRDVIRTHGGDDATSTFERGADVRAVRVDLGPGDDEAYLDDAVTARLHGGTGRDLVASSCACEHVVVRLATGEIHHDDVLTVAGDFESASASGAVRADLVGNGAANFLGADACVVEAHGRGGADILSDDDNYGRCVQTSRLRGGAGPDQLFGYAGVDELYGGRGHDEADGGDGVDLCRAEDEGSCEE